jgi:tRNA (guanine37-N1)-methyltransferase
VPTGFETIGHIAHLNLREEHLPFKRTIGQVFLDKNPRLRTVVNKTHTISNQFRVFPLELLAGVEEYVTEVRQLNVTFRFDYSKVYWNSRLDKEHERVVSLFRAGDIVSDMMCGIGPFALPAAKRGHTVYANDLNPMSYAALCDNIRINKLAARVHAFNLDGRAFWAALREQQRAGTALHAQHVVMNLPAIAIEFIDALCGSYTAAEVAALPGGAAGLPFVHCYCFSTAGEAHAEADVLQRTAAVLGAPPASAAVHFVRLVSPTKWMMRITFRLPEAAALHASPLAAHHQRLAAEREAAGAFNEEDAEARAAVSAAVDGAAADDGIVCAASGSASGAAEDGHRSSPNAGSKRKEVSSQPAEDADAGADADRVKKGKAVEL